MQKKTIIDIARMAKVSTATVSRVINNKSVSKKTKERILKLIERYEYHPNSFAQYLGHRNNSGPVRKNVSVYTKV